MLDSKEATIYIKPKNPRFVVNHQGSLKFYWDLLIIALAIFNCITIPFGFAFQPPIFETAPFIIINWLITGIFAVDILVNLRTSYIDGREGELVQDGKRMAVTYLKSFRFTVDLLSTIPFPNLFASVASNKVQQYLSMIEMLKLFRASRIGSIIARLKYPRETKAFFKLL